MKRKISSLIMLMASFITAPFFILNAQNTSPYWSLSGNTNATAAHKLGTANNIPLRLFTNNAERIHINANVSGKVGYVGIGTTAPNTRLHVNGVVTATAGNSTTWNFASRVSGSFAANRIPRYNGTAFVNGTMQDNGTSVGVGTVIQTARLTVASPTLTAVAAPGGLQVGETNLHNLVFDHNKVQARVNGAPGVLSLQEWGGDVIVNTNGGNTNFRGKVSVGGFTPVYKLDIQGDFASPTSVNCNSNVNYVGGQDIRAFKGYSHPSDGWGIGVEAIAGWRGIYAVCNNGGFGGGMGVSGSSYGTSGTQYGVYGFASGGTSNWALYASGITFSSAGYQSSDAKLKKNIKSIDNALAVINNLQPRTYSFKTDEYKYMGLPVEQQYGFIAQELEQVLPELVKEVEQPIDHDSKKNGMLQFKAINYTEVIPLLTQGMKEQQKQIEELRAMVKDLESALAAYSGNSYDKNSIETDSHEKPVLEQNVPNPFTEQTLIRYYIPSKSYGVIKIRSLEGKELYSTLIQKAGHGEISITGSTLGAGTYTYTLIVNGKAVESRLMVLSE